METRETVEHAQVLYLPIFLLGFDAGIGMCDLWIWCSASIGPYLLLRKPGYQGPRLLRKGTQDAISPTALNCGDCSMFSSRWRRIQRDIPFFLSSPAAIVAFLDRFLACLDLVHVQLVYVIHMSGHLPFLDLCTCTFRSVSFPHLSYCLRWG